MAEVAQSMNCVGESWMDFWFLFLIEGSWSFRSAALRGGKGQIAGSRFHSDHASSLKLDPPVCRASWQLVSVNALESDSLGLRVARRCQNLILDFILFLHSFSTLPLLFPDFPDYYPLVSVFLRGASEADEKLQKISGNRRPVTGQVANRQPATQILTPVNFSLVPAGYFCLVNKNNCP